ncbi:hypothetical protein [Micromonospora sp. CB01531]|nr:hypothetical protein [Micromonospora sp. CB01531]
MDSKNSPLTLIIANQGWKPQTSEVKLKGEKDTVADFALSPLRCD